jgi:beta-lactamase class A
LKLIALLALAGITITAQTPLADSVHRRINGFDGTVSLYAKNLDTGAEFALRADERVRTASTIKLPIMAAAFHLAAGGKLRWEETLLLRGEDKVSGSGVLHEFSDGVRLPIRDVMHLMIVVSDNTATNLILDRIGADAVNAFMDELSLPNTRSLRKVRGDGSQLKAPTGWSKAGLIEANKKYGLGVSTPREMVRLMELLDQGKVVDATASKGMISILKRQQFKDGIGRRIDSDLVASKSGSLDALRSDVGIFYGPGGRIAMSITVDGMPKFDYSPDNPGLLLVADLAKILVDGLSRNPVR